MIAPQKTSLLVGLLLSFCLSIASAVEPPHGVAEFSPAMVISGSAHERGLKYGTEFSQAIREFYVMRAARRDRHAGWFTFVMADGEGNLLNIEGSPSGVVVETSRQRLLRVGFGTLEMTGAKSLDAVSVHPRCEKLGRLLDGSRGKTGQETLQNYLAKPEHQISVGKSTIDMMVFNTTARTARLSRGPDYGESWREFRFHAKNQ